MPMMGCLRSTTTRQNVRCDVWRYEERIIFFAGDDSGGERAATIYSPIGSAKLNGLDPERISAPCSRGLPIIQSAKSNNCCPGAWPQRPTLPAKSTESAQ